MWIVQRSAKADEKSDSMIKMENRFGSVACGESNIDYQHLYLNQCGFSIKIKDFGTK